MSHETVGTERRLVYTMPAMPSDVLRSREFHHFFREYRGPSFSVQTRDGWRWFSSPFRSAALTVTFSSRERLDAVIGDSTEDSMAKTFLDGHVEIRGDIFSLLGVAEFVLRHSSGLSPNLIGTIRRASLEWLRAFPSGRKSTVLTGWRFTCCPSGLAEEFFQRWLGSSLSHSCARFVQAGQEFDLAQQHAVEHICSLLQLSEDDHLMDMCCGWGALILHAAAKHGARSEGVAFSTEQAEIITERIRRKRLDALCTVERRDLSTEPCPRRTFEKIVDVGLFHQVAHSHLRAYLAMAHRMLVPGGLFLLHRVTRPPQTVLPKRFGTLPMEAPSGGVLAPVSAELQVAEASGFRVLSVEDISRDYELTLHHWIGQLQRSMQTLAEEERREARSWLFHHLDSAAKLDAGDLQLHQVLLSRPALTPGIAGQFRSCAN